MKIERVPKFLLSPDYVYDCFDFENTGRFIICRRAKCEIDDVTFCIYDTVFNNYIELTADPLNPIIPTNEYYIGENIWKYIDSFLPVEQMVMYQQSDQTCGILLLINFDFQKKTYKIVDYINLSKCENPEFVRDGDIFGLFFTSSIDGEMVNLVDNETSFFTLLYFTVEENHIKLGEKKRFNYKPYNKFTYPMDLYIRNNKLWYIRKVDQDIFYLSRQNLNLRICYFDLKEMHPSENFVDEIQIEESKTTLIMQWVQDSLVYLQRGTKFNVMNLLNFEWSSEALGCGIDFTNLDLNGEWQSNGTWVEFHFSKKEIAYWACQSPIHFDNEFVITAVNRKSSVLHKFPLRQPLKLSLIAWSCALNAGLIQQNANLPPKLPYSRVF